MIPGFSLPFRRDRTENGGGLLLYIRQGIPAKSLQNINITGGNESLFGEMNLYKKKLLIGGTYNPNKSLISSHIDCRSKRIDYFIPN